MKKGELTLFVSALLSNYAANLNNDAANSLFANSLYRVFAVLISIISI